MVKNQTGETLWNRTHLVRLENFPDLANTRVEYSNSNENICKNSKELESYQESGRIILELLSNLVYHPPSLRYKLKID